MNKQTYWVEQQRDVRRGVRMIQAVVEKVDGHIAINIT